MPTRRRAKNPDPRRSSPAGGPVAELERRVARLEDELAIHRLIVSYGLAVDVGDPERSAAVFTPDGVYDVDVGCMQGRAAVADMVAGPYHQAMVGHCAHQIGPAVVEVLSPDRAVATGYSRVYLETRAGIHVYRVSTNRWEFVKREGRWWISRRTTRRLGHAHSSDVLREGASVPMVGPMPRRSRVAPTAAAKRLRAPTGRGSPPARSRSTRGRGRS